MSLYSTSLAFHVHLLLLSTIRHHPAMFEPFVVHSIRSFTNSAERLAARNSRIKVNFARLTHNQRSTRASTLTRTDPRLSRRSSILIRPPEWFPVIQHCRVRPQIICILSDAAPSDVTASGTCVQFPRYRARDRACSLFHTRVSYRGEKQKYGTTSLPRSRAMVRLSVCAHTRLLRSVGQPAATRSCRRHDTIVSRPEKLHRGNNRYDSCRELHLAVFPHSPSAISLSFISFRFSLSLPLSLSLSPS